MWVSRMKDESVLRLYDTFWIQRREVVEQDEGTAVIIVNILTRISSGKCCQIWYKSGRRVTQTCVSKILVLNSLDLPSYNGMVPAL